MDYVSNNNKGLLWGILQESNIFQGIRSEKFDEIKSIFDNTIHNISTQHSQKGIMEKNKMTIEELISRINEVKKANEPKIKVIYKAEDLQLERARELNDKLKKYEDDMGTIGKVKKPDEINFSDTTWNVDDKPIGDEMDRLISEKMASRERELEIPAISSDAEKWITNGRDNLEKKKVSFVEGENIKQLPIDSNTNRSVSEVSLRNTPRVDKVVDNIFNILKRKTIELDSKNKISDVTTDGSTTTTVNRIDYSKSIDNNSISMNTLKQELAIVREKQDLLMNICHDILKSVRALQENNIRQ